MLAPLLLSGTAFSQQTDTIRQVVVAASRIEEPARTTPNQVRTIPQKAIERADAANTADLLTATGEVFVQKSQQGGGSPVLRGLEANRILLVVDGVRMNNAIYRGGHLQNVLRIDPFSLDRAEVVGGPGSLVYGSDALGGVATFFTKIPAFSGSDDVNVGGSVAARYGSAAEEKTGHADLQFGGKKWASLTSATFSDFGDLRQGAQRTSKYPDFGKRGFYQKTFDGKDSMVVNSKPNTQVGAAYRQMNFLQKFRFKGGGDMEHGLTFGYTTTGDVPRYDRLTHLKNGLPQYAEWYYGPEKWAFGSYQLKLGPADRGLFDRGTITAAAQRIEESRHSRNWGSSKRKDQVEKVTVVTINGDFERRKRRQSQRYGFEIAGNEVGSKADFFDVSTKAVRETDTRYPDGGSSTFSAAAYAADQIRFSNRFYFNIGARYNYSTLSARFENRVVPFPFTSTEQENKAWTGNVGLVALPSNSLKISILGSTGFRTPNVDDMGKVFESVKAAQLIVPNTGLKPERARNAELTIETTGNGRVQAGLTGYAMLLEDALGLAATTFNGSSTVVYDGDTTPVFSTQNLGKARVVGATARASVGLTSWLRLDATGSWCRGRLIDDGEETPFDHIPPMFGRAGLTAARGKWSMEAFGLFSGKKKLDDYRLDAEDNERYATADGTLAYWTLNWRASLDVTRRLSIQAAAENILDVNYRPFASGLSGAGRDLRVSARFKF